MFVVKKDNPLYSESFDANKFYEPVLKHITDERIRLLYFNILNDPYAVLREGDKIVLETDDPLAVYEAMWEATQNILADIQEDPSLEVTKYGNHDTKFYLEVLHRIEHEIEGLKAGGFKSKVFATYEKAFREARDKYFESMEKKNE